MEESDKSKQDKTKVRKTAKDCRSGIVHGGTEQHHHEQQGALGSKNRDLN